MLPSFIGKRSLPRTVSIYGNRPPRVQIQRRFPRRSPTPPIPPHPTYSILSPPRCLSASLLSNVSAQFPIAPLYYLPSCTTDSTLAFCLVSGPITIGRIAIRLRKRMFWWDDLLAIISLVGFTLFVTGKLNPLRYTLCVLLTYYQASSFLPTVGRPRKVLALPVTTWVS